MTKDEIYEALYVENQDLDVFYNAARLGKTVERCLKQSSAYSQAQTNDILFYVLYYAVAKNINRSNITANDVKSLDLSAYSDEYILDISKTVYDKYESLGGDSKVAKGSELIKSLEGTLL